MLALIVRQASKCSRGRIPPQTQSIYYSHIKCVWKICQIPYGVSDFFQNEIQACHVLLHVTYKYFCAAPGNMRNDMD